LLGGDDPHALSSLLEDAVARHQLVIVFEAFFKVFQVTLHRALKSVEDVVAHTAKAEVIVEHPRSRHSLKDIQEPFPLAPGVQKRRGGTQVHREGAKPKEVACDPLELGHDKANILSSLGHLDFEKLFHGHHKDQLVVDGSEVIRAVGVRNHLKELPLFGDLFKTRMQVSNIRLGVDPLYAAQAGEHAQNP